MTATDKIDKTCIGWFAYKAMCDRIGLSEEVATHNWPMNDNHWPAVAKIIEAEAIRRYQANQPDEVQAPTPRYGNFLEVTRDLCR